MGSAEKSDWSIDDKLFLWATLSNDHEEQYQLAFNIYRNLFDMVPEAMQMFPENMHPNSIEVKKNLTFQRMALYLIRSLWSAATNVDQLEKQAEMLQEIGKPATEPNKFLLNFGLARSICFLKQKVCRSQFKHYYATQISDFWTVGKIHAKYASRGLKPEHWPAMKSAMVLAMKQHVESCTSLQNSEQKSIANKIWGKVIAWVIEEAQKGFMAAIPNKQSEPVKLDQSKQKVSMKNLFDKFSGMH